MKKVIVIVLSVLFLASCFGSSDEVQNSQSTTVSEPAPAYTPAVEVPAVEEPALTNEQLYINGVRAVGGNYVAAATDAKLVDLGETVCTTLDSGISVVDMVASLTVTTIQDDADMLDLVAGTVAGATMYLCPEYYEEAKAFANGN